MPIVLDPPVAPALPAPSDDGAHLWELLYSSLGFHVEGDAATGYQLRKLCEALVGPYQRIYDLVRERDDMPAPFALFLDPDECPAAWLPYLAQYVGIIPTPEMSEAQLRAEIKEPTGWRRGQAESIKIAIQRTLTGTKTAFIRPRQPTAGTHYVATLLSETPEPVRTERVVRENVPAWERLLFEAVEGVRLLDLEVGWPESLEELEADFTTLGEIEDLLASELPE